MRAGLAIAVVLVGAMLAATTGVVAASVISMGLISLPIMMRYGYSRPLAAGVITASGTLAQIIPPSIVLIVIADQLGQSVGDIYKGAVAFVALQVIMVAAVLWKPQIVLYGLGEQKVLDVDKVNLNITPVEEEEEPPPSFGDPPPAMAPAPAAPTN